MAKKKNKIYHIDAFTSEPFLGNPAAVTFGDEYSEEQKQLIAREMNLSETAFLSKSDKATYKLQWFTPTSEVKLCGHATIASLHFLHENKLLKNGEEITFETLSGVLRCRFENGKYFMQIPVFKAITFEHDIKEVLDALNLDEDHVDPFIETVLLDNGNLYICVNNLKTLQAIKPDFNKLKDLSADEKKFEAVAVYTLETIESSSFAHLRFFAPAFGINEDPVTGSANGPLLTVLKYLYVIEQIEEEVYVQFEQGDFIKHKGRIGVTYYLSTKELYISGDAVTVLKGELNF
ncbi:MAG: PhzF family phenazine biosynthesis protein [Ignavibacteriaceae bacterium]|nr:PhzF family phenazine biosynthesis protein [Ignavibacteriaceae bacterium]